MVSTDTCKFSLVPFAPASWIRGKAGSRPVAMEERLIQYVDISKANFIGLLEKSWDNVLKIIE